MRFVSIQRTLRNFVFVFFIFGLMPLPVQQLTVEAKPLQAPLPGITVSTGSVMLGENFNITATFRNTGDETGYGPFIDLYLPHKGMDGVYPEESTYDGISPASGSCYTATASGESLTTVTQTFPDSGDGTGCVNHPWGVDDAGMFLQVCGTAGDQLLSIQLPYGSYTPGQPTIEVEIPAHLSTNANLGEALNIRGRAGFIYGETPMVDWCCTTPVDTTIVSDAGLPSTWIQNSDVVPTVVNFTKRTNQSEVATGPSNPGRYSMTVVVAEGQSFSNIRIRDQLPDNLYYLGNLTSVPAATNVTQPAVGGPYANEEIVLTYDGPISTDIQISFDYYIPKFDAGGFEIVPDSTSNSAVLETITWTPADGSDPVILTNIGPRTASTNDRSITLSKGHNIAENQGGTDPTPGDVIRYNMVFEVSDYYGFADLELTDVLSDGQRFYQDGSYYPTLQITRDGGTVQYDFTEENVEITCNYSGSIPANSVCDVQDQISPDGTTDIVFDIAQQLSDQGVNSQILGDLVVDGNGSTGATVTGTVTFYAAIQDTYTDEFPGAPVLMGDSLEDSATILGTLVDEDTCSPGPCSVTASNASSEAADSITIGRGSLFKSIIARNDAVCNPATLAPCADIDVAAGDTITYRLQYGLTSGDYADLSLTDFLPLPIFHAEDPNVDNSNLASWPKYGGGEVVPDVGTWMLGPADTHAQDPETVTVSPSTADNSIRFYYGDNDNPENLSENIDILFTIRVTSEKFGDGLRMRNSVLQQDANNPGIFAYDDRYVDLTLTEPILVGEKSVVSTDHAGLTIEPPIAAPITFAPPGDPGAAPWNTSQPINSEYLNAHDFGSGIEGIDGGDLVKFAIVIENQGTGINGAFDITVKDVLPDGYEYPGIGLGGFNLQVYRGDGTALDDGTGSNLEFMGNSDNATDFFDLGIRLKDPDTGDPEYGMGACQAHDLTNGKNVIIITYDLRVKPDIAPGTMLRNVGEVTNYSSEEGGENYVEEPIESGSDSEIGSPSLEKQLFDTEIYLTNNDDTQAVIGETVKYQLTITVPEGSSPNTVLVDILDPGLAFVGQDSFVFSDSEAVSVDNDIPTITNNGRTITWNLGSIINTSNTNETPETITITYTAIVENAESNQNGTTLNNSAEMSWSSVDIDGNPVTLSTGVISAENVTVLEPVLNISKSASVLSGDAGDEIIYSILISHDPESTTDAHDLLVYDNLSLLPVSFSDFVGDPIYTGSCQDTSMTGRSASGDFVAISVDYLRLGCDSVEFRYAVTLDGTVTPDQVITNTADLFWTSFPETGTAASVYTELDCERSGNDSACGLEQNDYLSDTSSSVTVNSAQFAKSVVSTELEGSNNTRTQVVIGEVVNYELELTIPEGQVQAVTVTDTLDNGLAFVDCADITASDGLSTDLAGGFADACNDLPGDPTNGNPTVSTDGRTIEFDLGTVTNANRDNATDETILIRYEAVVLNTTGNNAGVNRNNNARPYQSGLALTPAAEAQNVTIIEPAPTVSKSATIGGDGVGLPGETVIYTLTITNTSVTDAYDLVIYDALPKVNPPTDTRSLISDATINNVTGTDAGNFSLTGDNANGWVLNTVTDFDLQVGAVVTITIQGTLIQVDPPAVSADQLITNVADMTWTSLDGNPGQISPYVTSSTERNGSGGVNDYATTDDADIRVENITLTKQLFDLNTNEVLSGQDVRIGDTVGYRVTFTIPRDVYLTNLTFADVLDEGLAYAACRSITADAALTSSQLDGFDCINPTLAVTNNGRNLDIGFGNVANTDLNLPQSIVLEYSAVVLNSTGNDRGDTLNNAVTTGFEVNSNTTTLNASAPNIMINEPTLNVNKTVDSVTGDAGNQLTFTITVTSDSGTNFNDAYNVVLEDTMPSGLSYVANSFTHISGLVPTTTPTYDSGTETLTVSWDVFPPGQTSIFTFQAVINATVAPNQVITNQANLEWTSLPDDVVITDTDSDLDCERTGNTSDCGGSANDYSDSESEMVTVNDVSFDKFLTGSSHDHTSANELTIGETASFALSITLPEGTIPSLVVSDMIPSGMAYVANSFNLNTSTYVGTYESPVISPDQTTNGADGQDLVVTFGQIVTTNDNITTNNTLVFEFDAVVLNTNINHDGSNLINRGSFQIGANPVVNSNQVTMPVVEPELTIIKSYDPTGAPFEAGESVPYQLVISNNSGLTAYDVEISDLAYANVSNLVITQDPVNTLVGLVDISADNLVNFTIGEFPSGTTLTINYEIVLPSTVQVGETIENTAVLKWTSLPEDGDSNERSGFSGSSLNDYYIESDQDFSIDQSAIEKLVDKSDATIGETVNYTLRVTSPLATIRNWVIEDTLPAGLIFTSVISESNYDFPAPVISSPNDGTVPVTVTWTMPPDVVITNNIMEISFDTLVADVPGNQDEDVLQNFVEMRYTDGNDAAGSLTDSIQFTVYEPDLAVVKTFLPNPVGIGQTAEYTITLEHSAESNANAFDLTVSDLIPVGLNYVDGSISGSCNLVALDPANLSANSPDLEWTIAQLPFGQSCTLTYDVTVDVSSLDETLVNSVEVDYSSLSGTPAQERDYQESTNTPLTSTGPNLTINKNDGTDSATPGDTLVYMLTYSNEGNGQASGIVITETVPVNTSFNAAESTPGWVCTPDINAGSTCTLSVADLSAGEGSTALFAINLNNSIPTNVTQIQNQVSIADDGTHGAEPTPDVHPNTDNDTDTLDAAPDLVILKSDGGITTETNSVIVYTLTYDNIGNQDAVGVVISETVPANTTFNTALSNGVWGSWACADGSGPGTVCTFDVGSVPVDDPAASIPFVLNVNGTMPVGVEFLSNTAEIMDDGSNGIDLDLSNNESSDTTPVNLYFDLEIEKSDQDVTVVPGDTIQYQIRYRNTGNQDVGSVTITETIPENSIYNESLSTAGWNCSGDAIGGDTCTYEAGTVLADPTGATWYTIEFSVDVEDTVPTLVETIDNDIAISSLIVEENLDNNSAQEITPLVAAPDLYIGKDDGQEITFAGETLVYTITYGNSGNQDAESITIQEIVPVFTTVNPALSDPRWDCSMAPVCILTLESLEAGEEGTAYFAVDVLETLSAGVEQINNTVSIGDDGDNGSDQNPENNLDSDIDTLSAVPDLAITKNSETEYLLPGEFIVYFLDYENIGPQDASGVVITEIIPEHTSFNPEHSDEGWICEPVEGDSGSECSYVVGDVASGDGGSLLFALKVDDPIPSGIEEISNLVSITDDGENGEDPDLENNQDELTTPIEADSDLSITKDDGVVQTSPGSTLTYSITISNTGSQNASGVTVLDVLPEGVTFVSASPEGEYDEETGEITWEIGDLAGGENLTLTVEVIVNDPFTAEGSMIINTAVVSDDESNGEDPTPEDNSASDRDLISTTGKTIVETNQEHTEMRDVAIGEILRYQVNLEIAPGTVEGLTLTDLLDQGLAFVGCSEINTDPADSIAFQEAGYTLEGICAAAEIRRYPEASELPVDMGRLMVIDFGDVRNIGEEDILLTVVYDVVVLNSEGNLRGTALNNTAEWTWNGGELVVNSSDVTIVEPALEVSKTVSPNRALKDQTVTYQIVIQHTTESDSPAFNLTFSDTIPQELRYMAGTLRLVSGQAPTLFDESKAPLLRVVWDEFELSEEPTIIEYDVKLTGVSPDQKITNEVVLDWTSLPGDVSTPQSPNNPESDERSFTPGSNVDMYGTDAQADLNIPALPETGFAPGVHSIIPVQPNALQYMVMGDMRLVIRKQAVDLPVLGVPLTDDGWDLTWLSHQVGYLAGTTYPTWNGNTGLTAHVYNADGTPGPFVNLHLLRWGDQIQLHAFGKIYTYEVRSVERVAPNDLSPLRHEDRSWLTLITCQGYDEKNDAYTWRVAVRAVLIAVD